MLVTAIGVCLLTSRAAGLFFFLLVVVCWRLGASARLGCSSSSLAWLRWRLSCGVCLLLLWGFCFLLFNCPLQLLLMVCVAFCASGLLLLPLHLLLFLFLFPFLPLLGFLLLWLSAFSVISFLLPLPGIAWCLAFPCPWFGRPLLTFCCCYCFVLCLWFWCGWLVVAFARLWCEASICSLAWWMVSVCLPLVLVWLAGGRRFSRLWCEASVCSLTWWWLAFVRLWFWCGWLVVAFARLWWPRVFSLVVVGVNLPWFSRCCRFCSCVSWICCLGCCPGSCWCFRPSSFQVVLCAAEVAGLLPLLWTVGVLPFVGNVSESGMSF